MGAAEISFVSARIEHVLMIGDQGRPHGETTDLFLSIKVAIRNTGETAIDYLTIAGDENNLDARAAVLTDERGVRYKRGSFGMGLNPAGRVPSESLSPGRSLTDTLLFAVPSPSAADLTLTIQGRAVDSSGTAELKIPVSLIMRDVVK